VNELDFTVVGQLFGTQPGTGDLLLIDRLTGTGTLVGATGVGSSIPSLAIHPTTGQLFLGRGGGNPLVYTVNKTTGAATLVGNSGLGFAAIGGMDFRSDGVLYAAVNIAGDGGTGSDHLATINTATGLATVIGPFGTCTGVPALPVDGTGSCTLEGMEGIAFDASGTLWGSLSERGAAGAAGLYTIIPSTGLATFVTALDDGSRNPPSGGVVSLEFAHGTLFGGTATAISPATDGGFLITIDPTTGLLSKVGTTSATSNGKSLAGLAIQ